MATQIARLFRIKTGAAVLTTLLTAGCALIPPGVPTDTLTGEWTVLDVDGAAIVGDAGLTVGFGETGRVSGSAGCNRFTGAYDYDPTLGALKVTPLGVTRRACPPALMAQERKLIERLQDTVRVDTQSGGAIALTSNAGRLMLRRRGMSAPAAIATLAPVAAPVAAPIAAPVAAPVAAPAVSPTALPPPSTSSYPLAGDPASGAPLSKPLSPSPAGAPLPMSPAPVYASNVAAPAAQVVPPIPASPTSPPAVNAPTASMPGVAYRCLDETFRIAFEERAAMLVTADGATARLVRIDATDDPRAPRMFSNGILTLLQDPELSQTGDGRIRFARGRTALTACTKQA